MATLTASGSINVVVDRGRTFYTINHNTHLSLTVKKCTMSASGNTDVNTANTNTQNNIMRLLATTLQTQS